MKNFKKLSAIALSTLFATMQIAPANIDTQLGAGNGGASIIDGGAGYVNMTGAGTGNVNLNFDANSHVKWDTLNVNKNESLNFNAVNNANNLTILNSVNRNMSKIYGNIGTNAGISKLIIANPNGVLFDGAKFTTAGDVMITTKNMSDADVNNFTYSTYNYSMKDFDTNDLIQVQILQDSDFNVGGEFTIMAPKFVGSHSHIKADDGFKLITANGSDYLISSQVPAANKGVALLKAMNIDGNVEIVNEVGGLAITEGGKINGDLKANVGGLGYLNINDVDNRLDVKGNVDLTGHGQHLILRNVDVDGNVKMTNDGGAVDLGNAKVKGDVDLTTKDFEPINSNKYNHYVHVIGNTEVGGDLNIESSQNIHLGNYRVTNNTKPWQGVLLDGNLKVDGDLNAHTTGGHIMTTINTSAKNVNFNAETHNANGYRYGGNILSDGKSVITADTYKFKSAGYIGGLKAVNGQSIDNQVIDLMENYIFVPADIESHDYLTIGGGTITNIETPNVSANGNDVQVYIKSTKDVTLNGANAGVINMTAPDKQITITGDVHAKNINIGDRTGTLKLDFPSRDFTTNYTSIKDKKVVTINPDEEITYELANKPETGYNSPDFKATDGTTTTYLVGPDKPADPDPGNTDPGNTDPGNTDPGNTDPGNTDPGNTDPGNTDPGNTDPGNTDPGNTDPGNTDPGNTDPGNTDPGNTDPVNPNPVNPTPAPDPVPGDGTESAKLLHNGATPMDINAAPINTPVAFAADLDEDQAEGPCRKNVDGSVTVVRAYAITE